METETTEMLFGCAMAAIVPYLAVAIGDWVARTVSGR